MGAVHLDYLTLVIVDQVNAAKGLRTTFAAEFISRLTRAGREDGSAREAPIEPAQSGLPVVPVLETAGRDFPPCHPRCFLPGGGRLRGAGDVSRAGAAAFWGRLT